MSIFASLIEKLEPKEESFDIELPLGESLKFRYLKDPDELGDIKSGASEFIEAAKKKRLSHEMMKYHTTNVGVLGSVFLLSKLCLTEGANQAAFMALASKLPFVYESLAARVDAEITGKTRVEQYEAVESAKNESGAIWTGETASKSPETLGTDTPTN